jgi:hypothetical protein
MEPNKVFDYLQRQLKILEEIKVNTDKQGRFVRRGEMRGLRRLLGERQVLIDELVDLTGKLAGDHPRSYLPDAEKLRKDIAARKLEIRDSFDKALREAMTARARIGVQLRDIRTGRRLQHQYVSCWTAPEQGSRFNKKG